MIVGSNARLRGALALCAVLSFAAVPSSAKPVTVADLIGMTTFGSNVQGNGGMEDFAVMSADGKHLATVVKRGNMDTNTVDYRLLVFPEQTVVAQFSTSSNRPAIWQVRWLEDNATLAFLAEAPGELPQAHTVDIRTGEIKVRTQATTQIHQFTIAPSGNALVYAAEPAQDRTQFAQMQARGFALAPNIPLWEVMKGDWQAATQGWYRVPREVRIVQADHEVSVPLPTPDTGYKCNLGRQSFMAVSPGGDSVLVLCSLITAPPEWSVYRHPYYLERAQSGIIPIYLLLDAVSGKVRRLIDAPALANLSRALWSPDGQSVVVTHTFMPLDAADPQPSIQPMHVEVDVGSGAIHEIAREGELIPIRWDAASNTVDFAQGKFEPDGRLAHRYYRKSVDKPIGKSRGQSRGLENPGVMWSAVAPRSLSASVAATYAIDETMNTPPRLVRINSRSGKRSIIYDPNPGLLSSLRFGREEVLRWKSRPGEQHTAGLYWPPDYKPGQRYPLVIQTHGFNPNAFWPYGPFTTGAAAQPLANHGVLVVQLDNHPASVDTTLREGPWFQEAVEGLIDELDRRAVIDRTKVALQGFSRTCFQSMYFLTQSSYPIAAAMLSDGVDFGYIQYIMWLGASKSANGRQQWEAMNGGQSPFSPEGVAQWARYAPGFNLQRVRTPALFVASTTQGLFLEWEAYQGLLWQGKAAELILIPDGDHILFKPLEQLTSQQTAVDWYRFWLQDAIDSDPSKAAQYARWGELRKKHLSASSAAVLH